MSGKIYVITGPSGVGKGTLCNLLLDSDPNLSLSISATSRSMRDGETDSVNYFFKTREQFEDMIAAEDQLLEWAEYNGNYYGTPRSYVESKLAEGQSILLEIETQGALMVKDKYPEARLIFIAPPSFEELETRLRGRGTETDENIENRLTISRYEMTLQERFDHTFINEDLDTCLREIRRVMDADKARL